MQVLNSFSSVTGLRVNWTKSLLFPIDPAARDTAPTDIPLQWVENFKYLGVVVSRRASDYLPLNLSPVVQETQKRLKSWESLPLSIMGRINLFKMKILPKFTYLFRHSPQWIPKSFFIHLHRLLASFIWGSQSPRYSWTTLIRPTSQGGLACPDLHKYYLAAQLVTAAWWFNPDISNPATQIEAAVLGSLEALKFLLFRGPRAPYPLTPSMRTTLRAWGAISPNAPLWLNSTLKHIFKLPEHHAWTKFNIKTVTQIVSNQSLVPLSKLNSDCNIPQSYFFRFLQLSHAFGCQFSSSPPQLNQSSLEDLLRSDCTKKPTSQLYSHLTITSLPTLEKLRSKWSRDIPDFDSDDWDDVWDFPFSSLVSLRDRLIQFKIVHRAYFTPHRLHKMNPDSPLECWRCGGTPGDFTHIFWTCPAIVSYWREILDFITQITSVPLQPSMSICILGLTEQLIPTVAGCTLVGLLLFYARKAIALSWRKSTRPPLSLWKQLINNSLPLYKDTYDNRGCPNKYSKVWSKWLADPLHCFGDLSVDPNHEITRKRVPGVHNESII